MYTPQKFSETDTQVMIEFMQCNAFATLISYSDQGLSAEHIPFIVDTQAGCKAVLRAHIAKANPLWKRIESGAPVLVAFQGSNSYISPNWYPSKITDSKVVPTWNYTAVHAKGKIEFIHDAPWLLSLLNDLTNQHEKTQNKPWTVSDAPTKFVEKQLASIVGLEIIVENLEGKFKLSQNQSPGNRQGVKRGLDGQNHDMAGLIDD